MNKYIDAEKLKSIIKAQIKERKEWMKDIDRSDRQDQLWSDLNLEDMSILNTINSLQQEQPEVDLEEEFEKYMSSKDENGYVFNRAGFTNQKAAYKLARTFFELGLNARKEE